jgi:hypothetical protein
MHERKLRRGHRRRSERLSAQIPVQLAGDAGAGQEFLENSQTLTLSQHGASILSQRVLKPNQKMIIRRVDTGKESKIRVAGKIGDRDEGYVYAVEFLDSQANLWETDFPPAADPGETDDLVFLVCGCCGKSESVNLGEPRLMGFEATHGILLYCIQCQAMTRWMQQSDDSTTDDGQSRGDGPA